MRNASVAVVMALLASGGVHAQTTVYSQNFESGVLGLEWSGAGSILSTQGLSAFGFANLHLKNDGQLASVLSLSALDSHTTMTLSFSLAMWDSIDYGLDFFQVQVNGSFVINETFGNYFPPSGSEGPGTPLTPPTNGEFTDPQYGYRSEYRDSARAVSITFDHTASSGIVSFQFPASQGAADESFGIDNVVVSINTVAVPEPATIAFTALGMGGILFGVRRHRRRKARRTQRNPVSKAEQPSRVRSSLPCLIES